MKFIPYVLLVLVGVAAIVEVREVGRERAKTERLCRALMATSRRFAIHKAPMPHPVVLSWMVARQDDVLSIYEQECL